jgi:hypothetical protein
MLVRASFGAALPVAFVVGETLEIQGVLERAIVAGIERAHELLWRVEIRAHRCERYRMIHGPGSDKFAGKRESDKCSLLQVGVYPDHRASHRWRNLLEYIFSLFLAFI